MKTDKRHKPSVTPLEPDQQKSARSRRMHILGRLTVISLFIILIAFGIIFKAVNNTIVNADEWNKKGTQHLDDTVLIKPLRGDILASDGCILATNLNYFNLRIDFKAKRFMVREYAAAIDSLADSLAYYYPRRTRDGWKKYLEAPMNKARKDRSSAYMLLKEIPDDEVQRVKKFPFFKRSTNANRTGLVKERVLKRKYPYGEMATLSIGRVGEVGPRDVRGVSGLERALDSLLYGTPGKAKKVLFTDRVANWTIQPPKNGYTVTTTIDITMQDILEYELGSMLLTTGAEWGTAMIMDVETGDIKAISNLEKDTIPGSRRYIEAMNRAVLAYEPGSVVKTISMIIALEDGFAFPLNKEFHIEPKGVGFRYAGGRPINDTHSPSSLPVSRFLEYSSNIGMAKLMTAHFENDPNSFRERLRDIGFFDRFNTGMARERTPYFPTIANNRGGRIALSRMVFGYSTMIPPLYTCAMYNAIANDGKFVRPRLVKALRTPEGKDSVIPVSYIRDSICSSKNAALLRDMLHEVVWGQGGTAKALKSKVVSIAGKTGTCRIMAEAKPKQASDSTKKGSPEQRPKPGGYLDGHYRLAFCGFFPYENPKYTGFVMISDPGPEYKGAATTAGMVLKNVAHKLYSRGMLDNKSDINGEEPVSSRPTLYASHDNNRHNRLAAGLKLPGGSVITAPSSAQQGHVPDVRGLGIREAVVTLEKAGYNVEFSGIGYVASQQPAGGTRAPAGSKVTITLKQD
ncbi:MAG: transpeptidase family protein [Muribaculaceae bacterium]|nr:transpeptidase family protein [Muribaculaceae bacterium]